MCTQRSGHGIEQVDKRPTSGTYFTPFSAAFQLCIWIVCSPFFLGRTSTRLLSSAPNFIKAFPGYQTDAREVTGLGTKASHSFTRSHYHTKNEVIPLGFKSTTTVTYQPATNK